MLKIVLVAATLAVAMAVPQYPNSAGSGYGAPGSGSGSGSGRDGNIGFRATGPIESDPNLVLENEGKDIPSDIVDQPILDRVVDAISEELAQQAAAAAAQRAATAGNYGAPAPGYGPPSSGYGAPLGAAGPGGNGVQGPGSSNGRITLLIPPDPLKAKLIANYIQRGVAPFTGDANSNSGNRNGGGYQNQGSRGGY